MNRSLLLVFCLSVASKAWGADPAVQNKTTLTLASKTVNQSTPIAGSISFSNSGPHINFGYSLKGALIGIEVASPSDERIIEKHLADVPIHKPFPHVAPWPTPKFSMAPTRLSLSGDPLKAPLHSGKTYAVQFTIDLNRAIRKSAHPSPVLFKPGNYRVRAVLRSHHRWGDGASEPSKIYGEFRSEWVPLKIEADDSDPLLKAGARKLFNRLDPTTQRTFLAYYRNSPDLTVADLKPILLASKKNIKGLVASVYVSKGGSPEDLTFFRTQAQAPIEMNLKSLFFLRSGVGETIHLKASKEIGRFSVIMFSSNRTSVVVTGTATFEMPKDPGVYQVTCPKYAKTLGWVLVTKPK